VTRQEALEELGRLAEADQYPEIQPDELARLLDSKVRARVWAPSGVYNAGQRLLPVGADPTQAGACYVVVEGGISGTSAPLWPTSPGCTAVTGSLSVRLLGAYDGCQWDLRGAAHEAWKRKTARTVNETDFKAGGQEFSREAIHAHCKAQIAVYAPEYV
jgi:hypothetical protein